MRWIRHILLTGLALTLGCGADVEGSAGTGGTGGAGATGGAGGSGAAAATGGSSGSGGTGATAGNGGTGATAGSGGAAPEMKLGISGDRFTIDGEQKFLLGVSYFDGRSWHAEDLDGLRQRKFNLIRIWLDWAQDGFFDAGGTLAKGQTLLDLVHAAKQRGLVVDVTILDTDLTLTNPTSAVEAIMTALAGEPNVFFDLVNEHDHSGNTFSHDDVKALAQAARAKNPQAILTVSSQGGHIVDDLTLDPANIDAEIVDAGLDLLTPHFSRTVDWYDKTDQRIGLVKGHLASIAKPVPVYLQEEARRGYGGFDPTKDQFVQAAREARDSGAAGWVFHTDAGFDLTTATFFQSLDPEEQATVDALGTEIFGG